MSADDTTRVRMETPGRRLLLYVTLYTSSLHEWHSVLGIEEGAANSQRGGASYENVNSYLEELNGTRTHTFDGDPPTLP